MKWERGRQYTTGPNAKTGYFKKLLARGKTWDVWLIDYPEGVGLATHIDPVKAKEHHRLNIRLMGPEGLIAVVFDWNRHAYMRRYFWRIITYFRPDTTFHCVLPSDKRRLVLSIGWTRDLPL